MVERRQRGGPNLVIQHASLPLCVWLQVVQQLQVNWFSLFAYVISLICSFEIVFSRCKKVTGREEHVKISRFETFDCHCLPIVRLTGVAISAQFSYLNRQKHFLHPAPHYPQAPTWTTFLPCVTA